MLHRSAFAVFSLSVVGTAVCFIVPETQAVWRYVAACGVAALGVAWITRAQPEAYWQGRYKALESTLDAMQRDMEAAGLLTPTHQPTASFKFTKPEPSRVVPPAEQCPMMPKVEATSG